MPRNKVRQSTVQQPVRQLDGAPLQLDDLPPGGGGLPALHGNERHTVAFQSAADVTAAIVAHTVDLHARQVQALHPHAVVDQHVGITRAFLRPSAWQWGPRRLHQVLYFATLRG